MLKQELIEQLAISKSMTIPMWLKRVRPDILQYLEQETSQYEVKNVMERVYILLNGEPPKCSDGNYRKFDTYEKGYRLGCNLNHKCKDVVKNRVEKQRLTLLEKYGVTNAAQLDSVQAKIKETNLKKYGVEHHSQNEEVKFRTVTSRKNRTIEQVSKEQEKRKTTSRLKYGVEHHMQLKTQQEKVQSTNNERYGVSFPQQKSWSPTAINFMSDDSLFTNEVQMFSVHELVKKYEISAFPIYTKMRNMGIPPKKEITSAFENEVLTFIKSNYSGTIENNTRKIISPYEIDIYLPDLKLAVECNGTYWHSELGGGKNKEYHINKTRTCDSIGIRLIHIWEHDWYTKNNIIQSMIKNKLGLNKIIQARKCKVSKITNETARTFLSENHLQGSCPASVKLGLFYDDVLVMVMTLGKSRYNKQYTYELLRMASKTGLTVTGGASRLISYFKNNFNPESIISYADRMYSNGDVYRKIGFTNTGNSGPCYKYTQDYVKMHNRVTFQKHKLINEGYDSSMTEWEIMQQRGFDRIWDCGQTTWAWARGDK